MFACDNNEIAVAPLRVLSYLLGWVDIFAEIYTYNIENGDNFNHIFGDLKIITSKIKEISFGELTHSRISSVKLIPIGFCEKISHEMNSI